MRVPLEWVEFIEMSDNQAEFIRVAIEKELKRLGHIEFLYSKPLEFPEIINKEIRSFMEENKDELCHSSILLLSLLDKLHDKSQ